MAYFPFFIDIKDKNGLIIGGGKHAVGKIEKLLPYEPKLHVITTEISEEVRGITSKNEIRVDFRKFQESDLEPRPDFVIIACDDMEERKRIANLCRERHILVNSVDDIENCDFIFPSLIQRGKLSIGVMTGGASPVIGMELKKQILELIPDNIEEILEHMERIRPEMKEKYPDEKERAKVFREIYRSMIIRMQN